MAGVKVTPGSVAAALGSTDWRVIDALTDEDVARYVAEDPAASPILTEVDAADRHTRFKGPAVPG